MIKPASRDRTWRRGVIFSYTGSITAQAPLHRDYYGDVIDTLFLSLTTFILLVTQLPRNYVHPIVVRALLTRWDVYPSRSVRDTLFSFCFKSRRDTSRQVAGMTVRMIPRSFLRIWCKFPRYMLCALVLRETICTIKEDANQKRWIFYVGDSVYN